MLEHVFIHSLRKTVAGQNAPALSIKASDENIFKWQHFVVAQRAKISGFFKKKTPHSGEENPFFLSLTWNKPSEFHLGLNIFP